MTKTEETIVHVANAHGSIPLAQETLIRQQCDGQNSVTVACNLSLKSLCVDGEVLSMHQAKRSLKNEIHSLLSHCRESMTADTECL